MLFPQNPFQRAPTPLSEEDLLERSDAVRKTSLIKLPSAVYGLLLIMITGVLFVMEFGHVQHLTGLFRQDELPLALTLMVLVTLPVGLVCGWILNFMAQSDLRKNTLIVQNYTEKVRIATVFAPLLLGASFYGFFFVQNRPLPQWGILLLAYWALCLALGTWIGGKAALIFGRMLELDEPRYL